MGLTLPTARPLGAPYALLYHALQQTAALQGSILCQTSTRVPVINDIFSMVFWPWYGQLFEPVERRNILRKMGNHLRRKV